ncbi:MAG TPA: choice-of-anchor D domain-containing protein [Ktedonobacteraceae bacterium]|nr:choice-of-anchor D domain-containing protein [Ktedonobacteraceae bacterium]
MRVIHCEQCGIPLPWTAQYCANCGEPVSLHAQISDDDGVTIESGQYAREQRPASLKTYAFYTMGPGDPDETQRLDRSRMQASSMGAATMPLPFVSTIEDTPDFHNFSEDWPEEAGIDDEMQHRDTWQKFVTRKTPAIAIDSAGAIMPVTPPYRILEEVLSPDLDDDDTITSPMSMAPVALAYRVRTTPPPPALIPPPPRYKKRLAFFPLMPRLTGWITIGVILALLLGGGFGVFVSLGRNATTGPSNGPLSLQVTPASIAFGGIVTLRGSHFTPFGRIGLTRDAVIPVIDTGGSSLIKADASGSFSDTVSIDGSWTPGAHSVRAEDARLHKTASFTILVTGQGISLRPAHLMLSVASIDLGSGDQATNSTQAITLSNAGGGQISWQSTVTQPWLMLSPTSGTLAVGQHMLVTLAADRSSLKVGAYSASVIFTSNTGDITLPIKMQVTPLQPGHEPVIQVSPAVLSFTGMDGGASPASQVVTISNPGALPLQWNATSATNDGSNWLSTSPQSGTVAKGNGQAVTVNVNSSQLLPGVYYGSVTFSSPGTQAVVNNPQTIYVSVTIVPQCTIQVSPGSLSFTGVYLQPAPAAKGISVGVNQSCSVPLNWAASVTTSSGGHWLTISASRGTAPSTPIVGINVTGLLPGTYSGALVFSSAAGTQTLPVTLVMGQATTPILSAAPALLNVNGVIGQTTPTVQSIVVSNTGGGALSWSAVAATTVGGAWLTASPASGTLAAHANTTITVTVTLLKTLIPGSYTGSVTVTGIDSSGHAAAGSPQTLPVTFIVQAPCSITTSAPALVFQSVLGQPAPLPQQVAINAVGACANPLSWSAAVATVPAGGTWLTATAAGTVSVVASSSMSVSIVNTGLVAGTYTGSVTIPAIDSVTHLAVGLPQVVTVTLTVQPACTLQAPSVASETFSSEAGANPAAQTFTVGVIGACTGNVTITPTATMSSGSGWLAVSPSSASVAPNGTATFTVTVTSAALTAGTYGGTISLAALSSTGVAITGSPQAVGVSLNVLSPPVLSTAPASLTFNIAPVASTQTITIKNTGGEPLNWSAALASGAPGYVTIASPAAGSLAAGASTTITISVNATGLPGGTTASTSVTISATDPLTSGSVSGSPSAVAISISVTAPPAAMQLSKAALSFTTTAGTNPAAQTLTITNSGGGTLNWTAGAPSQSWLTVAPASGSDAGGGASTSTFTVNVASMTAGTYTATVNFTAPGGISQTVTVTLTIN